MANKPSQRTHRMKPEEGLNLTPMIDMITCLMFFLMMFASILPVVIIDAPLPKIAATADEVKMAKKNEENKLEVMVFINSRGVQVKTDSGGERAFPAVDGKYPYEELHKFLVQVKGRRDMKEITLMPADDTPYEVMVGVMDAARELRKEDPGYQPVPPEIADKPESQQFNRLFPDVSIGGV